MFSHKINFQPLNAFFNIITSVVVFFPGHLPSQLSQEFCICLNRICVIMFWSTLQTSTGGRIILQTDTTPMTVTVYYATTLDGYR